MSGIGVNVRVTGNCNQGGRKYMEDMFSIAYQQTQDLKELEYAYFGIFDGHGGPEAAIYAKDHLIDAIVSQNGFWSDNDRAVLRAIRDGYIHTHYAMYKQHESWPRTASGLPSTSGTTATVAFIRKGKIYIGHVGDSCLVLGYQEKGELGWRARPLTVDHKPESQAEINRIRNSGGKVVSKSGVPRVVWNRPRLGHKGPVRRSTPIDEIPFLAVARALGDFWSYNSASDKFVVSPEPDVRVFHIDVEKDRCLILGTDGLWNMLSAETAVSIVQSTERHNKRQVLNSPGHMFMQYDKDWINPSKTLVDRAIKQWACTRQRADNTSVVTLLLDPPGPPKAPLSKIEKQHINETLECTPSNSEENISPHFSKYRRMSVYKMLSDKPGVAIFTRYPVETTCLAETGISQNMSYVSNKDSDSMQASSSTSVSRSSILENVNDIANEMNALSDSVVSNSESSISSNSTKYDSSFSRKHEEDIQINEVSSSLPDIEDVESLSSSSIVSANTLSIKRKLSSSHSNRECSSRYKLKLKRLQDSDDGNSDIENKEHWVPRSWSDRLSSSSSKNPASINYKRRKCSFEQKDPMLSLSTSKSTTSACCDKTRMNKLKTNEEIPTRMLRSDTLAATPVRTLRSRNINLLFGSKSKSVDSKPRSILNKSPNELMNNLKRSTTTPCMHSTTAKQVTNRAVFSCPTKRTSRLQASSTSLSHLSSNSFSQLSSNTSTLSHLTPTNNLLSVTTRNASKKSVK